MRISKIYKKIKKELLYLIFIFFNGRKFRINALIIGGQRCATTSMINFLSKSKSVIVPKNMEQLFFFSDNFDKSENYKKYHIKFIHNYLFGFVNKYVFIEKTPEYCLKKKYLDRIHRYNKKIKLIFIFREPYSRIQSAFELHKKLGYSGNFKRFLTTDNKKYNVLNFSNYISIYNRIFSIFKIHNVLLVNFNQINSPIFKSKVSRFLNINLGKLKFDKLNSFKNKSKTNDRYYKMIIKNLYGSKLDKNFKKFQNLYKKYDKKFNKIN